MTIPILPLLLPAKDAQEARRKAVLYAGCKCGSTCPACRSTFAELHEALHFYLLRSIESRAPFRQHSANRGPILVGPVAAAIWQYFQDHKLEWLVEAGSTKKSFLRWVISAAWPSIKDQFQFDKVKRTGKTLLKQRHLRHCDGMIDPGPDASGRIWCLPEDKMKMTKTGGETDELAEAIELVNKVATDVLPKTQEAVRFIFENRCTVAEAARHTGVPESTLTRRLTSLGELVAKSRKRTGNNVLAHALRHRRGRRAA